eukprot:5031611-Amphidinium_carterae.1
MTLRVTLECGVKPKWRFPSVLRVAPNGMHKLRAFSVDIYPGRENGVPYHHHTQTDSEKSIRLLTKRDCVLNNKETPHIPINGNFPEWTSETRVTRVPSENSALRAKPLTKPIQ